jgi:hypothetical protein
MQNSLVVFGKSCVGYWNVGFPFLLLTILKQMVLPNNFIVVLSRSYVVVVLVHRMGGVLFLLSANLH